ncbi:MAG: N-methyl-L-tryptophan oxidase [Thermomicrobiales bacterium]|nr:N-methyl-L-tryptophan oxidase [Thermomicrobiales bacterium]
MTTQFDVIVVGCGGMGSAAAYHLARRGSRVLALERYNVPHTMGSFHGVNRIIRLAYYEDPSYVPLLRRAYELWRSLQDEAGEQLLYITGSVDASPEEGEVFAGALRSCELHDLEHEVLNAAELAGRFPGYQLPDGHFALLQPEGGYLLSERCVVAHVNGAMNAGAVVHAQEQVLEWTSTPNGVRVTTNRGSYEAEQLVLTAGAWNGALSDELSPLLSPERQVLCWFQPTQPAHFSPDAFPVFNLTVEEGRYYGFPVAGIPGFKVGRYHHFEEMVDPDNFDRDPNDRDEAILRQFTDRYFPAASGPVMSMASCIFTNTPDEHFIIDRSRAHDSVVLVSPCSGHGYKFCSVVGEIVADLVIDGSTRHDTSLFALDRFAGGAAD